MDPPKGAKVQAALVCVIGVTVTDTDSAEHPVHSLLVDDVQLLSLPQADAEKPMLANLFVLATLPCNASKKAQLLTVCAEPARASHNY